MDGALGSPTWWGHAAHGRVGAGRPHGPLQLKPSYNQNSDPPARATRPYGINSRSRPRPALLTPPRPPPLPAPGLPPPHPPHPPPAARCVPGPRAAASGERAAARRRRRRQRRRTPRLCSPQRVREPTSPGQRECPPPGRAELKGTERNRSAARPVGTPPASPGAALTCAPAVPLRAVAAPAAPALNSGGPDSAALAPLRSAAGPGSPRARRGGVAVRSAPGAGPQPARRARSGRPRLRSAERWGCSAMGGGEG